LQALEEVWAVGGGLKFIDVTTNFRLFIRKKKINKIRSSLNLESYAYAHGKIILKGRESCFILINNLQPKIIYICLDR